MHDEAHDDIQRQVLDGDWTGERLAEAARLWAHVERCAECATALKDYDRLRLALAAGEMQYEPDRGDFRGEVQGDGGAGGDFRGDFRGGGQNRTFAEPQVRLGNSPGGVALEKRLADHCHDLRPRRVPARWRWSARLAAMLALLVLGWWSARLFNAPPHMGVSLVSLASFLPQHPEEQVGVFEHVAQVFDGHASWVALSADDSQLGVAPHTVGTQPHLLLLRLTVTQSRFSHVVSQTDLAIVPGQSASLTLPFQGGRTLHYRIAVSGEDQPRLTLWAQLEAQGGERTLAAMSTQLNLQPGQVSFPGQLLADGAGYQLSVGFREASPRKPRPRNLRKGAS